MAKSLPSSFHRLPETEADSHIYIGCQRGNEFPHYVGISKEGTISQMQIDLLAAALANCQNYCSDCPLHQLVDNA